MKKKIPGPPKWAEQFLGWYCKPELLEDLQGDLNEYFERNLKNKGARRARFIYVLDVLKFFRPYTLRKLHLLNLLINMIMLGSYIKTSRRNIVRNKLFSGINIFGLGVSMSVGLLMIAMLLDVFSYDRFHDNHDRIHRLISRVDPNTTFFATSSLNAGFSLKDHVNGVKDVAILRNGLSADFEINEKVIPLSGYWTGESFFEVFSFDLLQGNPATALKDPFQIVVTESAANKLFGTSDALGRAIVRDENEYIVAGILKDPPIFSHFKFEVLGSLSTLDALDRDNLDLMKWDNVYNTWSYVLLNEGVDPTGVKSSLDKFSAMKDKTVENTHIELDLQPLGDIMIGENMGNQIGPTFGKTLLRIFIALTVVLLLSACFNYTNLSVARSLSRTKEVGIRKTIGAFKSQIVGQFVIESILISLLALVLSFILFIFIRPHFLSMEDSLQQLLKLELSPMLVLCFIGFAIMIGILAGLVPAVSFSRINAIVAFKNRLATPALKGFSMRKILTVFQYSISIIAITSTLIIFKQYKHFIHFDLGFSTENILNIKLQGNDAQLLRNELNELSEVQEISQSMLVSGIGHYNGVSMKNPNDPLDSSTVYFNKVDEHYLTMHSHTFLAGRNFHPKLVDSLETEVIVNEEVIRRFNIAEGKVSDAVGQTVQVDGKELAIVGVIGNFEYGKASNQTGKEVIMRYANAEANYLNVKIQSQDLPATYAKLEAIWKKLDPVHPFEAQFYNQQIQDGFKGLQASVKAGGFLSLLVICIASIGLLGMVVFTTELRLKEVSVRKVMGSSEVGLILLLSRGFLVLLAFAAGISVPATYLFFDRIMLPQIPNSLPLQLPEMLLGSFAVLLLALLMILSQTLKVARTNPAEVLNRE
ncbi:ABC transporter permease [Algoriphagus sp. AGSA1]|uniref:ABC transporter permease n=1 Tax=Algoriphagus sp. AGSA1 TaxID=2907213 RepID=UPI001F1CF96E|nr:ABC transporter permease [Algoriphagus sp. AGSA1]MCE7054693.1 ABC transporter permease [Algoriphagus sp. AGSA1]